MTLPDEDDYDPDDNFAQAFGADADIDEDAALEALVWQLLLLVNPDDEDAALQQFRGFRDALGERGDESQAQDLLREAIDWKAGFYIHEDDPQALVECLDELAARFNLRIDWGEDEDEDGFAEAEVPALIHTAFDRLREHHYTLWTWETGDDHHAGWITRQHDDEALRLVAGALGFHVRTGAG
jgi:hypothetical protein